MNIENKEIRIEEPADNNRLLSLCRPFGDDNIKQLERRLNIEINRCNNTFKLVGEQVCIDAATSIFSSLYVDIDPMRGIIAGINLKHIYLAIKQTIKKADR